MVPTSHPTALWRSPALVTTLALGAASFVFLTGTGDAHAEDLIRAGARATIGLGGSATSEFSDSSTGGDTASTELSDAAAFGVNAYGLVGIVSSFDLGLSLHYIPGAGYERENKTEIDLGSEFDLNIRASYVLPVPAVDISFHGEAGAAFFFVNKERNTENNEANLTPDLNPFDNETTSPAGFNFGLGAQVGIPIVPFLSIVLGFDFQYYTFQAFAGEATNPPPPLSPFDVALDLSGTRFRLAVGVEFGL